MQLYYFSKQVFGARFYDPVLGIWISGDPARQYSNPYSFGGDPINGHDPTGLWRVGLGVSVGYTSEGGFSLGVGYGCEDCNLGIAKLDTYGGADYNYGNGSTTYSGSVGGGVDLWGVKGDAGVNASYNSQTGSTAGYYAGTGVLGGDVRIGGTHSWSGFYGSYQGNTHFAEYGYGGFGGRTYGGYEWGFAGQQGRGAYAGVGAFGLNAEITQNQGWSVGGRVEVASYSRSQSSLDDYVASSRAEADDLGPDIATELEIALFNRFANLRESEILNDPKVKAGETLAIYNTSETEFNFLGYKHSSFKIKYVDHRSFETKENRFWRKDGNTRIHSHPNLAGWTVGPSSIDQNGAQSIYRNYVRHDGGNGYRFTGDGAYELQF